LPPCHAHHTALRLAHSAHPLHVCCLCALVPHVCCRLPPPPPRPGPTCAPPPQDNLIRGRFLAELTREVFSDLEQSKYQHAEMRISIYGRKQVCVCVCVCAPCCVVCLCLALCVFVPCVVCLIVRAAEA
jgi:hypothetical protein